MSDPNYQTQIYLDEGGNRQVVESAGEVRMEVGAKVTAAGTQAATIAAPATVLAANAPAGGTGAAAGAWDTAPDRDTAIALINNLKAAVAELQTEMTAVLVALKGVGVIASS